QTGTAALAAAAPALAREQRRRAPGPTPLKLLLPGSAASVVLKTTDGPAGVVRAALSQPTCPGLSWMLLMRTTDPGTAGALGVGACLTGAGGCTKCDLTPTVMPIASARIAAATSAESSTSRLTVGRAASEGVMATRA